MFGPTALEVKTSLLETMQEVNGATFWAIEVLQRQLLHHAQCLDNLNERLKNLEGDNAVFKSSGLSDSRDGGQ